MSDSVLCRIDVVDSNEPSQVATDDDDDDPMRHRADENHVTAADQSSSSFGNRRHRCTSTDDVIASDDPDVRESLLTGNDVTTAVRTKRRHSLPSVEQGGDCACEALLRDHNDNS